MSQYKYPLDMTKFRLKHGLALQEAVGKSPAVELRTMISVLSDLTGIKPQDMRNMTMDDFNMLVAEASEQIAAHFNAASRTTIHIPKSFSDALRDLDDLDDEDVP